MAIVYSRKGAHAIIPDAYRYVCKFNNWPSIHEGMDAEEATRLSRSKQMDRVPGILESIYDEIRFNVSVGWINYVIKNSGCIVGVVEDSGPQSLVELVESELQKKGYTVYRCCESDDNKCSNYDDIADDEDSNRYDYCLNICWDI